MNILIVGLGSIAQKHIDVLKLLGVDYNIFALRSGHNSKNIEGVTNIFSLEETDVKFDFAIIANPTHLHYNSIDSLINQGFPLFIEKPAVHSLENTSALIDKIEQKKIITLGIL